MLIFTCIRCQIMILSQSNIDLPSWSSGSRRRPLTAETRVRFPMGVPNVKTHLNDVFFSFQIILRESNGRISTQSCELCARPRRDNKYKNSKARATAVFVLFLRYCKFSICIAQTNKNLCENMMCFCVVCFKTKDRRRIQTCRTIRVLQA